MILLKDIGITCCRPGLFITTWMDAELFHLSWWLS